MANTIFTPVEERVAPQSYEDICESEQLTPLEAWIDPTWSENAVKRIDVSSYGDECFLLKNLLTKEECSHYINAGESLRFHDIHGATATYRNCKRIMVHSPSLAAVLWKRVQLLLSEIAINGDPHDVHIHGVHTFLQGNWKPVAVNDIFRLCKYAAGGHFAPHFDGHLVKSPTLRTMKTLMIYLNGDFEGGTTNFVDESQMLYQDDNGRYCAEEKNILCRITPEAGLTLVFNHHRLHEGEATKSGFKYILRTDIIYEKSGDAQVSDTDSQAFLLVQEAERLESHGESMKAMELYRKAFKLSPSIANSYGN